MPEYFDPYNPPAAERAPQGTEPALRRPMNMKPSEIFNPAPVVTTPFIREIMPVAPVSAGAGGAYATAIGPVSGGRSQVRYKRARPKANQSRPKGANRPIRAKSTGKRGSSGTNTASSKKEAPKAGRRNPTWLKRYQFKKGNQAARKKKK